ncbi:MAG TPA: glycosyltransferase family 39 protein [Acidimicrobiia bacterium]|nr:glycosyltransferase family 39 protein [Acidimicrobiia bacterium]
MNNSRNRAFLIALLAIAVLALVVRIVFVLVVDPRLPDPGDATAYHLLANNLADGHGYIRPFDFRLLHVARPTAEYPPLFPALLAVPSYLGATSVDAQRVFLCFVGTGTVVLVGLLGRRVGGPIVGLVAAAIAAVYPMLFLGEAVLMAESLFVLLVTAMLFLAYSAADAPSPLRFAALGLVIGLSALTRAEGLLFAVVLVIPLALSIRAVAVKRRVLLAAVTVGVAVLTVAPWTIRNAARLHAFVPISNNIGTAVDGANCDLTYSGAQIGLWRETFTTFGDAARRLPQAKGCFEGFDIRRRNFDETDVANFHRRSGVSYARHHLSRAPLVVAVRELRTWGLYAPRQQIEFESLEGRPRRWQGVGTVMYWVLLSLAVAGAIVLVRRRVRVWPLVSTAVVASVTTALTYGQQRFRIAAEPAIVVLAAVSLAALAAWRRPRTTETS